ncbi:MAG: hypothetical protein OXI80_12165, partial [Caldilineaceae bacterium]|nr:hypothetical protein [Caldilineaceae bacterium]
MPRRELWLLNALLAPSAQAFPVWVSVSPESPLATAGAVLGDGLSPVETITIRTRYRTDVTGNSGFNDPSGRVWLVNEVLRQGRRWLDVGLSRYALRSYPRTLAPPDAVRLVP